MVADERGAAFDVVGKLPATVGKVYGGRVACCGMQRGGLRTAGLPDSNRRPAYSAVVEIFSLSARRTATVDAGSAVDAAYVAVVSPG